MTCDNLYVPHPNPKGSVLSMKSNSAVNAIACTYDHAGQNTHYRNVAFALLSTCQTLFVRDSQHFYSQLGKGKHGHG